MVAFEFHTWSDILLGHYVFTVIISVIAVAVTFIISRMYEAEKNLETEIDSLCFQKEEKSEISAVCDKEEHVTTSGIKQSPALIAEKVIQANMTEEQRLLEYRIRQQQLAQIYELMQKQSDKFGDVSLSEVEEQMKLYQ